MLRGAAEKYDAFAASNAAIAASGTVALELAMARLPAIIAYRINPLTHAYVSRVVKIAYANLINVILGREAVPELLQYDCTPEKLAGCGQPVDRRPERSGGANRRLPGGTASAGLWRDLTRVARSG